MIKSDLKKSKNLAKKIGCNTKFIAILIISKPKKIIPVEFSGIIKYRGGINSTLRNYDNNIDELEKKGKENLFKKFDDNVIVGNIIKDSAFGINFGLDFYIIEPATTRK